MTNKHLYCNVDGLTGIYGVNISSSHSSSMSNASINCINFTKNIGDLITVDLGYSDAHGIVFTGYIKQIDQKVPDNSYTITAEDQMTRAIDYFIASDDPDNPYKFKNKAAEDIIKDLFEMAGYSSTQLSQMGASYFTLSTKKDTEVNLVSAYDYSKGLCDIIAYNIWCDENGYIQFGNRKPHIVKVGGPESNQPGIIYDTTTIVTLTDSDIIDILYRITEKDLRNRVVVYGYNSGTSDDSDTIHAEASNAMSYDPRTQTYVQILPTDYYKTAVAANVIIDTTNMAQKSADYNLVLYNRLGEEITMTCLGNYVLQARKALHLTDSYLGLDRDFYIFAAQHSWNSSGYTCSLDLRG